MSLVAFRAARACSIKESYDCHDEAGSSGSDSGFTAVRTPPRAGRHRQQLYLATVPQEFGPQAGLRRVALG